jgi:hypothetical protein
MQSRTPVIASQVASLGMQRGACSRPPAIDRRCGARDVAKHELRAEPPVDEALAVVRSGASGAYGRACRGGSWRVNLAQISNPRLPNVTLGPKMNDQ